MAEQIPMSELGTWLTDLLEKEAMSKLETFDEILHKRSIQLRGKLTATSPKDTRAYARGWRIKTAQRNHEKVRIIYNVAKPWLTYVLEYGNAHQGAQPHIRLALEETVDEIMEELIDRL